MDGVFSFLKPPGITSHDAIAICRRLLGEKRIGHGGTLDPMAYGVLPVFVGKATRLIEYTDGLSKTYVGELFFHHFTDTEDTTGQVVPAPQEMTLRSGIQIVDGENRYDSTFCAPSFDVLQSLCESFLGEQDQQPSKYSAIKVDGVRAYEWARKGIDITLPSRRITIYAMEVVAYAFPYVTIRVTCTSGTYIRALFRDLAISLGIPGCMSALCRTEVGPFSIGQSIMAEELMRYGGDVLQSSDMAVHHLPKLDVNDVQLKEMQQGKPLAIHEDWTHTEINQRYRVYGPYGFIGIVKRCDHSLRVEKNIFL